MIKRPEILAPAGNFEKMRFAILYGADAVYLAGKSFGMRTASDNFTDEELAAAIEYAHGKGVRVYVTVNIMPRPSEEKALREYLAYLGEIAPDALIISDIGVFSMAKKYAPTSISTSQLRRTHSMPPPAVRGMNSVRRESCLQESFRLPKLRRYEAKYLPSLNSKRSYTAQCAFPTREDAFCRTTSSAETQTVVRAHSPAAGNTTQKR